MILSFSEADILESGVAEVIGRNELVRGLAGTRPLNIKLGIDPTSRDIHLGRTLPLWRLRAFQEMGHHIHLIIGDFTGQIGDTSDKESERPMLSAETVTSNLEHYLDQVWMILNTDKADQVHIHYNSSWLSTLTFSEIGHLADAFSVNQFIKRELVNRRLEAGSRISLREMLYPLMQGYDSLMVKADVELGGSDQRFNNLAGRILQEQAGLPPQAIILNQLIAGLDGRKMSSSWGNGISLLDSAQEKFGKLMSVLDELMADYLNFLPYSARPFTAEQLQSRLSSGDNPRDLKLILSTAIVALYHGEDIAADAAAGWMRQFSEHQLPTDLETFNIGSLEDASLVSVLVAVGFAPSRTEARRLIEQGGVTLGGERVSDVSLKALPGILQKGKRQAIQLELS